jgi:hypothetical protein
MTVHSNAHCPRLYFLAGALFSLILLAGCGSGSASQGGLSGSVTDVDGRSVAGATVSVGSSSTTSLSNGTFTLPGIGEGYQRVVAVNTVNGQRWSGETWVDLVGDHQNRSINVVISDERYHATLGGSVIDPNGIPLEGAKVFIGGPFGSTLAVTDRNGNYVANRLTPGATYTVSASLAGFKNDTRTVHLDPNEDASLSFALATGANLGTLPAPTGVVAQAWTLADTVTRAANNSGRKGDVYDWLQHFYRHKRGLPDGPQAKVIDRKGSVASGRATPSGSVIEIDLFWDYQSDPQLFGYAIKRALSQGALPGADVTAVLRDPLAAAFFDVDRTLTPDTDYFYTVHRLDTITFPASGAIGPASAPASANPLSPIRALAPTQGASVAGTPVFSWTPVNGAAAYQIYLWDEFPALMYDPSIPNEPNASQPIWPANPGSPGSALINAPATSVTYQGPALVAGRTYYWLVVALDSANLSNVSALSASQIAKFVKR